jgi:hypothetical protein
MGNKSGDSAVGQSNVELKNSMKEKSKIRSVQENIYE